MEGQEANGNSPGAELPKQWRFRERNEGNGNSIAAMGFSGMMLWSCNVAAAAAAAGIIVPFDVVVSIGHCLEFCRAQPNGLYDSLNINKTVFSSYDLSSYLAKSFSLFDNNIDTI